MRYINFLVFLFILSGCGTPEFKQPEDVTAVLDMAGDNRAELEKVIRHYKDNGFITSPLSL
jgi:hypothetical protein